VRLMVLLKLWILSGWLPSVAQLLAARVVIAVRCWLPNAKLCVMKG
jgi:hypothetical protein